MVVVDRLPLGGNHLHDDRIRAPWVRIRQGAQSPPPRGIRKDPNVPALEVQNLKYYYRTRRGPVKAVDDVSFSVEPGETIAIVGESGCGKTSTANAILRLLPRNVEEYEGHVRLSGEDVMEYSTEEFREKVRIPSHLRRTGGRGRSEEHRSELQSRGRRVWWP